MSGGLDAMRHAGIRRCYRPVGEPAAPVTTRLPLARRLRRVGAGRGARYAGERSRVKTSPGCRRTCGRTRGSRRCGSALSPGIVVASIPCTGPRARVPALLGRIRCGRCAHTRRSGRPPDHKSSIRGVARRAHGVQLPDHGAAIHRTAATPGAAWRQPPHSRSELAVWAGKHPEIASAARSCFYRDAIVIL